MTPDSGVGGWWMASDGRWYPPEKHPDHIAEPSPPPAPPTGPAAPGFSTAPAASRPSNPVTGDSARAVSSPGSAGVAAFASAPLPDPLSPPGARQRKTRYSGSRTWPVVTVIVVVMLAVVGGVSWFAVENGKPAPLPKHLPVPPFPTVPPGSGSASGQSPISAGANTGSTGSLGTSGSTGSGAPTGTPTTAGARAAAPGGGGGGCTPDPDGGCIGAGQPCSSAEAGQSATGPGGTFTCTKRTVVSDGGDQVPLGYFWQSG